MDAPCGNTASTLYRNAFLQLSVRTARVSLDTSPFNSKGLIEQALSDMSAPAGRALDVKRSPSNFVGQREPEIQSLQQRTRAHRLDPALIGKYPGVSGSIQIQRLPVLREVETR